MRVLFTLALVAVLTGCASAPTPAVVETAPPPPRWPAEAERFQVRQLRAVIEDEPPAIQEVPGALKVTAPPFRAAARVFCDLSADAGWSIGFVQAVLDKRQRNVYPAAVTSWEFPFVPVNDSDGRYPWYSKRARAENCSGEVDVFFSDGLWNSITWREPRPAHAHTDAGVGWLQGFDRWQSFRVWLVALHPRTGRQIVLRVIDWEVHVVLAIDTSQALGSRTRVVSVERPAPVIRMGAPGERVPPRLMAPPHANDADEFWWTPNDAATGPRQRVQPADWLRIPPAP